MSNLTNIFRWVWNHLVFIGCPVVGFLCVFFVFSKCSQVWRGWIQACVVPGPHWGIILKKWGDIRHWGPEEKSSTSKNPTWIYCKHRKLEFESLWRDGFFKETIFRCSIIFSYVLDRNFLGTSRNHHAFGLRSRAGVARLDGNLALYLLPAGESPEADIWVPLESSPPSPQEPWGLFLSLLVNEYRKWML